jgi:RNA polymerase sigma-70 factor (ECF subfamily)
MDKNELLQEKEMVKRAKRNRKDFSELYNKYSIKIERFILKKVNNEALAADLTSRVFEKSLKSLDSFQWQGVSFGSWLYKIARNTVYDYFRTTKSNRKETLEEELLEGHTDDIDNAILRDEREIKLYKVIGSFDKKDQFLLYYKYFEELDNKKIAQKMDMSEQNVATRLHRIRKKMEKELKGDLFS